MSCLLKFGAYSVTLLLAKEKKEWKVKMRNPVGIGFQAASLPPSPSSLISHLHFLFEEWSWWEEEAVLRRRRRGDKKLGARRILGLIQISPEWINSGRAGGGRSREKSH